MISKEEIDIKAEEFDINAANVQRDYVFSWILFGIYNLSDLKDELVLKGGNCLRKAYLQDTRFSSDLDFSVPYSIDLTRLGREFNQICATLQEIVGLKFHVEKNRFEKKKRIDNSLQVYDIRLYFTDFHGKESKVIISVRMDITLFDKLYLPVQTRKLIHQYSDFAQCSTELRCVKLEEVLASKLKCLIQRRHASDFYDYAYALFLSDTLDIDKREIASVFLKKTIFQRSPGAARRLLVGLPFLAIKSLWEKYIVCPIKGRINFEEAQQNFLENIKSLFGESIYGTERFFFPPELRNPILEAGAAKTLLRIVYHHQERLIEPYSLIYKVRKDGVGQEYFYAWDRTGGRSGPGIKTFTNNKIQGLENTDIKFEPRYEIEVAKAGEYGKTSYFSKPFSRTSKTSSIYSSRSSSPTYVYQCPVCNRTFKRKKRNPSLRRHKGGYGNFCFGKRAILIETEY